MNTRSGTYVTNLSGEMAYKSFRPSLLPLISPLEMTDDILKELIEANRQIAILDSLSSRIPNVNLFISMYVRKEALLSSQIEGTQCTLEDILNPFIDTNANQDVGDVINYISATEYALKRLKSLPLCNRLIKEIHGVLLQGVRGQEKSPGEFRYSQNWIGGQGSTLKNARYVPPNPVDMNIAMENLEKYINSEETIDPLLQIALIHYQFETIHPFLDGNGRIGRLLITLFLIERKVISTPTLYISYYLKINRIEYYDRMSQVRNTGNYEQWVLFFLNAISQSAKDAIYTIDELASLHEKNIKIFDNFSKRQREYILKVFNYLESNPIIEIGKTAKALNISYNTVSKVINILIDAEIIEQSYKVGRTKIYSYKDYLNILRKDT